MTEESKSSLLFNKDETRKTIQENTDLAGEQVGKIFEVSKPRKEQWIRVRGKSLEDLFWKNLVFLKDQDNGIEEPWLLHGDTELVTKLLQIFEGATRPVILAPFIDQTGTEFVWVCKQPAKGMRNTIAHKSGKIAIEHSQKGWRKVYWKGNQEGYSCIKPVDPDAIEQQDFDKNYSIADICERAFECKIIDSLDHTQVKIFRGQKL